MCQKETPEKDKLRFGESVIFFSMMFLTIAVVFGVIMLILYFAMN